MIHNFHPLPSTAGQLTITTSASNTSSFTIPAGATHIIVQVQTADVRCRFGTDPTASNGFQLPALSLFVFTAAAFATARFIRDASATANAVIHVQPATPA